MVGSLDVLSDLELYEGFEASLEVGGGIWYGVERVREIGFDTMTPLPSVPSQIQRSAISFQGFSSAIDRAPGARSKSDENSGVTIGVVEVMMIL